MQDHCIVAVKQIALKSVPGKLSNIRQKEVAILKVKKGQVALFGGKNVVTSQLYTSLTTFNFLSKCCKSGVGVARLGVYIKAPPP